MEPTPPEYQSKMRVALVRRNPADGAAPPGLKKSRTSKVTLSPALSLHSSLSPSSLSLPSLASTRRPVPRTARRRPRALAPPATAQRPHAAGPRGQGTGPTAPTARQDRKPPAPPACLFPGRRARAPAPPGSRSRGRKPPPFQRSSPSTGPSIVQGKSSVVSCRSMLDCSSLFMCERCLM